MKGDRIISPQRQGRDLPDHVKVFAHRFEIIAVGGVGDQPDVFECLPDVHWGDPLGFAKGILYDLRAGVGK